MPAPGMTGFPLNPYEDPEFGPDMGELDQLIPSMPQSGQPPPAPAVPDEALLSAPSPETDAIAAENAALDAEIAADAPGDGGTFDRTMGMQGDPNAATRVAVREEDQLNAAGVPTTQAGAYEQMAHATTRKSEAEAGAEARIAKDAEALYDQQTAELNVRKRKFDEIQADIAEARAQLLKDDAEVAKRKADPGAIWRDMSTGRQVAVWLGAVMAGFGQAMEGKAGNPNPVLGMIDQAVDRNIRLQMHEIKMAGEAVERRGRLIDSIDASSRSSLETYHRMAAAHYKAFELHTEALMREAKSDVHRANGEMALAQLGLRRNAEIAAAQQARIEGARKERELRVKEFNAEEGARHNLAGERIASRNASTNRYNAVTGRMNAMRERAEFEWGRERDQQKFLKEFEEGVVVNPVDGRTRYKLLPNVAKDKDMAKKASNTMYAAANYQRLATKLAALYDDVGQQGFLTRDGRFASEKAKEAFAIYTQLTFERAKAMTGESRLSDSEREATKPTVQEIEKLFQRASSGEVLRKIIESDSRGVELNMNRYIGADATDDFIHKVNTYAPTRPTKPKEDPDVTGATKKLGTLESIGDTFVGGARTRQTVMENNKGFRNLLKRWKEDGDEAARAKAEEIMGDKSVPSPIRRNFKRWYNQTASSIKSSKAVGDHVSRRKDALKAATEAVRRRAFNTLSPDEFDLAVSLVERGDIDDIDIGDSEDARDLMNQVRHARDAGMTKEEFLRKLNREAGIGAAIIRGRRNL